MTVTVIKDKKVAMVTVAMDSKSIKSIWPPLCQILKALCCNPVCCSVHKGLLQKTVTAALATIQIMVGLFSIGLGPGRISAHPGDLADYWLGGVFIAVGTMSIIASLYPTLCLVGFTVLTNIIGSVCAIIGVVLYGRDLADPSLLLRSCDLPWYIASNVDDACRTVASYAQYLLTGMDITLIILAALQLCVSVSFAVLGIKALLNRKEKEQGEDDDEDVEILQPELKQVLMTSPGV